MNLNELADRYGQAINVDRQAVLALADVFEATLKMMGSINPTASHMFDGAASQVRNIIVRYDQEIFDAHAMFSGNGPLALKMKEHLAFHNFFNMEMCIGAENQVFNAVMDRTLSLFIFDIEQDRQKIYDGQRELDSAISALKGVNFLRVFPSHRLQNDPATMRTGIYRSGYSTKYQLVLRADLERGAVLIQKYSLNSDMSPSLDSVHVYHPYEKSWVTTNRSFVLRHTQEVLLQELTKAIALAGVLDKDFDFNAELDKLTNRVGMLFFNEAIPVGEMSCSESFYISSSMNAFDRTQILYRKSKFDDGRIEQNLFCRVSYGSVRFKCVDGETITIQVIENRQDPNDSNKRIDVTDNPVLSTVAQLHILGFLGTGIECLIEQQGKS